jgi:tetratricopeptide (TPR) repeat protein
LRLSSPHLFLEISESLLVAAGRPIQEGLDRRDARRTLAVARCAHAEALNAEGRVGEAREAFALAEREARRAGLDDVRGQALIGTVHVLALAGEHTLAARAATRARKLLEVAGDHRRLGKLHMNRGNAFYQQDRYREAAEAYALADTILTGVPGEEGTRLGLLMNRGVVATALEQFAEARGAFERAEELAGAGGKPILEAYARYNRSFLVSLQGNYREGLRLLARAREIFDGEGARDMTAACDRARGEIHLD